MERGCRTWQIMFLMDYLNIITILYYNLPPSPVCLTPLVTQSSHLNRSISLLLRSPPLLYLNLEVGSLPSEPSYLPSSSGFLLFFPLSWTEQSLPSCHSIILLLLNWIEFDLVQQYKNTKYSFTTTVHARCQNTKQLVVETGCPENILHINVRQHAYKDKL